MSFSENLKQIRQSKGYSQVYMADHLNIDKSTYNGYESGKRKPDVQRIKAIAHILGVSADDLIGTQFSENKNSAPSFSDEALRILKQYEASTPAIQAAVRAVLAAGAAGVPAPEAPVTHVSSPKKVIPLLGARFAAGTPETAGDLEWENYETTNTRADFAIHVNGNSMEPVLADGSIALGVRRFPKDGEVGAFRLDGEFLVKQFVQDSQKNVYLFSSNRERNDADLIIWHDSDRDLRCYGTILCAPVPLP